MSGPLRQQTLLVRSSLPKTHPSLVQRRTFFGNLFGSFTKSKASKSTQKAEDPFLADLLSRKAKDSRTVARQGQRPRGELSAGSLFAGEEETAQIDRRDDSVARPSQEKILQDMAVVLDPTPRKRENWQ